jgi:crotonobetainyl-CoA:carnitine CoA-transferase CaiB-like acyl-CoA transferase
MTKLGLGFDDLSAAHPHCVYVSVSGFGNDMSSPYRDRMAFAPIVEAMSGIYAMKQKGDNPPDTSPVGGMGDISAALFATVGLLAALRERDRTERAQYVDVSMFDSVLAMTDIVTNFWSMGLKNGDAGPLINDGFRTGDGWIIVQVTREHYFARLAELIGHPEWNTDRRLATRRGWVDHLEDVIRPAIESWAATKTRAQACAELGAAGIAAGPCLRDEELPDDPHVVAHEMLVGMPRPQGAGDPVLVPGNPVRIHTAPGTSDARVPWVGESTDDILQQELGLSNEGIAALRSEGVVA